MSLQRVAKIHTQKLAVTRGSLLAGKLQRNETGQSPPSSSMVKNEWKYTYNLPYAFMVWIGAILLSLYYNVLYFTSTKKMGIIIGKHNQNQYTTTVMAEFFHTECKKKNVKIHSECQILQVVVCFLNFYSSKKYVKHPHEHHNMTVCFHVPATQSVVTIW
jgi:hypothetical protein